jgi:hypothetical protein
MDEPPVEAPPAEAGSASEPERFADPGMETDFAASAPLLVNPMPSQQKTQILLLTLVAIAPVAEPDSRWFVTSFRAAED